MNKTEFINELAKRTDRPVTEMYKFVNDFFTLTTEILSSQKPSVDLLSGIKKSCPYWFVPFPEWYLFGSYYLSF